MEPLSSESPSLFALFDAFPSMAFLADADAKVFEANRAARQWLGERAGTKLGLPLGEVFDCVFPRDSRGPCGTTDFCPSCSVRRSIEAVAAELPTPRRLAHMILGSAGSAEDRWFQVSASPLVLGDRKLVLVVMEDATQLVELRALLPLCPGCGATPSPTRGSSCGSTPTSCSRTSSAPNAGSGRRRTASRRKRRRDPHSATVIAARARPGRRRCPMLR